MNGGECSTWRATPTVQRDLTAIPLTFYRGSASTGDEIADEPPDLERGNERRSDGRRIEFKRPQSPGFQDHRCPLTF